MKYIKAILVLPVNNGNIVQSPGNGHCLVYSTMKSCNIQFYNCPQINIRH